MRVRISDQQIAICTSNLSFHGLLSFSEIRELELSFCWNFCLQGNRKVSATFQAQQIAYILLQKVLNCTLFSCVWIAFWPQTPNGETYSASPYRLTVGTSP